MTEGTPHSERILLLAEKWSNGTITPEEQNEFISWYNSFDDAELSWPGNQGIKAELYQETIARITADTDAAAAPVRKIQLWKKIAAAAAVISVIALAATYYFNSNSNQQNAVADNYTTPQPGYSQATLTLSNGKEIRLSATTENITDSGITIANSDGALIYNASEVVVWNKMQTPRGGQYRLVLPDGTKVWLNAASSIRYPTAFNGQERNIEITGEAYLEVKKDPSKPFRVLSNDNTIEVLGTSFNISSYTGEAFSTTLLSGAVKVNNNLLNPGQAITDGRIHAADTAEAVAWKNGFFQFNNTDLKKVMRQLERWYDLEIVYEGAIPYKTFVGELPRTAQLSQILRILSTTGLHYRMEGKRMIVTK